MTPMLRNAVFLYPNHGVCIFFLKGEFKKIMCSLTRTKKIPL